MHTPDDLTAQLSALELAVAEADDTCDAAEWLEPEEDPGLEIFEAAVKRWKRLSAELEALWRKAARDRFIHHGGHRYY